MLVHDMIKSGKDEKVAIIYKGNEITYKELREKVQIFRNYLYENGLRYELAALNPNSQKLFWVYIKTEKLDELLAKWSAKK